MEFKDIMAAIPSLTSLQRARLLAELAKINPPDTFADNVVKMTDTKVISQQERGKKLRERDLEMATRVLHKMADVEIEMTFIIAAVISGRLANSQTHIRKLLRKRAGKFSKAVNDYEEECALWGQPMLDETKLFCYQLIECVKQAVNKNNTEPIIDFVNRHSVQSIRQMLRKWKPRKGKPYRKDTLELARAFEDIYQDGHAGLNQEAAIKEAYTRLGIPQIDNVDTVDSDLRKIRRLKQNQKRTL